MTNLIKVCQKVLMPKEMILTSDFFSYHHWIIGGIFDIFFGRNFFISSFISLVIRIFFHIIIGSLAGSLISSLVGMFSYHHWIIGGIFDIFFSGNFFILSLDHWRDF